jgi:sulfonate transport system substrate-binding protein
VKRSHLAVLFFALSALLVGGCSKPADTSPEGVLTLRLGYFPNLTHAPALVGVGEGTFQKALGDKIKLDTKVFNAGPEISEAIRAGAIDIAYVGPSPAINLFVKTEGKGVRIISGASTGGASLVTVAGSTVKAIKDLGGKKVAVPQLGNTQDISLRLFLAKDGLQPKDHGGTVEVIPAKNADILSLFKTKVIDAAWVPEPWATRLVHEAGATRLIDERTLWPDGKFTTAVVITSYDFLQKHPDAVAAFQKANADVVTWMGANQKAAADAANKQLEKLTGKPLKPEVLDESWKELSFTTDPDLKSIEAQEKAAQDCGYMKATTLKLDDLILAKAVPGP